MIEIKNLHKKFDGNTVLDGVDLTIDKGDTMVIIGPSGIGKSVLLRHIIGLEKPDEGTVSVDKVDISPLYGTSLYNAIKNMGMLFQGGALFDSMTIGDNVAFYLHQHGKNDNTSYSQEEIDAIVDRSLTMVSLLNAKDKMPSDISGGMKKRAAFARVMAYKPEYLLYDEPTTGLDPYTSNDINQLILSIQKELKSTSVVVTHDIVSALTIADRICLLDNGKIAYNEPPGIFIDIDHPMIKKLKEIAPPALVELRKKQ